MAMRIVSRFTLVALLCVPLLRAQTDISIPVGSGAGVKYAMPERFGINLDDSYNYGNNQLTANLLASDGASFTPQIWQGSSQCSYSGANTWVDANGYSPQIGNFWFGATYQVISGPNAGATGTITDSRPATGAQGQTFTLSGTLSQPCIGGGNSDEMILRCRTPLSTCATGYTPSNLAGINLTTQGGGTTAFETTDVSPSSNSPQGMLLTAPGTAQAGVQAIYEGLLTYHSYINLNGTYTLTFRAKATAGTPTLYYYVYRTGGTQFLTGSVNPTVNPTPGAGWQNYSFTFTANENGAQVEDGSVWLDAQGGTVLLQDLALTEQPAGGNPTVFRNAVYQHLLSLHPGILRMMTADSWGCTVDNMMQPTYSARYLCGDNQYQSIGQPISYGWSDFMTLAQAVGADPWITFSVYSTPTDMANVAAYMSGTCGNGNPYTAMRCNYGQITPWTQVFNHIYLEMGNEIWNSPNGEDVYGNGGQNYGQLLAANIVALKASPFYTSNLKMVASGFELQSDFAYGWNWTVLMAMGTNLPDYIDGAPYMFQDMTDLSSTQNIFGPMFAEPVNYTLPSGATYGLQQYTQANFPGVNGAVYETNLTTNCALTGTTQTQINQVVAGVGAGLDATMDMLLGVRDAGVLVQNFFALPEVENSFGLATSTNSGSCPQTYSPWEPLWGSNLFMPGPTDSSAIDRPSGIALQVINKAIDNKLNVLNTVQTGTPTYNQPAAQPNPTSWPTAGLNSIAANSAVPYVQAFGFSDGAGNYSLIVYNVNLTANEAITFSGAAAPAGTVTKTVFTSANITDNNEGLAIGKTPVVGYPTSTTISNPTGDTLPPFSMTTYTWSTGATAGPTISVASSLNPSTYGQPVTFTATLTGTSTAPTGAVTFINGSTALGTATLTVTGALTSTATFTTSALPAGTDAITATYASSSSPTLNQTVSASTATAAVTSSQSPTTYGQAITLTATLTGLYSAPTGPVVFMNGATALASINLIPGGGLSSTATLSTSILPVGTDAITAVYAATGNFSAATSPAINQVVNAATTTTAVASSLNPSSFGQSVTLTATVSSTYAAPTGSVTFMNGTASLGSATLTPGSGLSSTATLTLSTLPAGTASITVVYAASGNYGGSTSSAISQVVNAASTTAAVTSSLSPANAGQSVTLTATITSGYAAPTGSVTFMNGATSLGSGTLTPGSGSSSTATLNTTTLPNGANSITVVYAATTNFGGSTSPAFNQVVSSAGSTTTVASSLNPASSGQSVTFTATVSSTAAAPTGSVTFMNGSTSLGSVALTPGGGVSSTATLATSTLPVGTDSITVAYAGNASFGASTSSALSEVVNGASTTATVASSLNPANSGQSVTLTATVSSGSAAPTGSVTFMNGSISLGSVALTPGGGVSSTATLATSALPVGTDSITVVFAASGNFGGSTSAALSEVVNGAPTTASVASSLSPSGYGQSVTLTATVSSGSTAPTGSVTFMNGSTSLGSATLTPGGGVSSTATLTTSALPAGTDSITVVYAATGSFGGSTSAALSQVVNGANTTASVTSSVSPASFAQGVTFMATVSSSGAAPTGSVTFMNGATSLGSATLTAGGGATSTATFTTTALPVGNDAITVVYAGTGSFGASTSAAFSQIINPAFINSAVVASSQSPSSFNQPVTFTATFATQYAAPTGSVVFMDGATALGSATLTPGGGLSSTASLTISTLPVGTDSITAVYAATTDFGPVTSNALSQVVNAAGSTTATVTSSVNPAGSGQSVTLTGTVVGVSTAPTGSVVFMDGSTAIGTANLTAAGGLTSAAALATSTLPVGTDAITVVYAGNGSNGAATSAVFNQIVNPPASAASVTSSANPVSAGQSVTFTATVSSSNAAPTGSVTFMDGATAIGSATLIPGGGLSSTATLTTSALPTGTDSITVVYAGAANFGGSTSGVLSQVVNPAIISALGSTTVLIASPNTTTAGQTITLTAVVTGSGATPTGTVTFYSGQTVLTIATLNTSGQATYSTSLLPVGTDPVSAVYSGDATYSTSTSQGAAVVIQAAPQGFTVGLPSQSFTVATSSNLTTSVTLSSQGGFTDTVNLSCGSLPTYMTCSLSPSSDNLGANGTTASVLTIGTATSQAYLLQDSDPLHPARSAFNLALMLCPMGLFAGIAAFPGRRSKRNPRLRLFALLLAVLPMAAAISGCATPSIVHPLLSAAAGTYTIPITATGVNSGTNHTVQLTLTVTP